VHTFLWQFARGTLPELDFRLLVLGCWDGAQISTRTRPSDPRSPRKRKIPKQAEIIHGTRTTR